jgi:glycosyltransferase involved in cell wall biosynthesis
MQPTTRVILDFGRASFSRLVLGYRVDAFREAFSELKSPLIVSFLTKTNLYVLEAVRGMNVRVVISERNDPDLQRIDPGMEALRQLIYREAYAVTSNSSGVLEKLAPYVPFKKLKLLPNPVVVPPIEADSAPRRNQFVAVARLVHQKGIDLLLEAFAEIAGDVRHWNLEIVGDGPLHDKLVAQAKELGIDGRVTFRGHVSDPIAIMRSSRVFVLPSRFEGMPNALLEAMACKLAPIVTDASPGPLESVRHNETGLVVRSEDVAALADAMRILASDDRMTDRLAEHARAYVREHDWSVIEPQWLQVLGIGADERAEKPLGLASGGR